MSSGRDRDEAARTSPGGGLLCPRCGAAMNRHAVKLDASLSEDAATTADGGVLQEFHTCPACRYVLERRAR